MSAEAEGPWLPYWGTVEQGNGEGVKAGDTGEVLEVSGLRQIGSVFSCTRSLMAPSISFRVIFHLLPVCLWQLSEMGRAPASAPPLRSPETTCQSCAQRAAPVLSVTPSHRYREIQGDTERWRPGSGLTPGPVQVAPSWKG